MVSQEITIKQSPKAVALDYLPVKWMIAFFIIPIVIDYLRYKNTELRFEKDFLVLKTGVLSASTKEIPYEDIKSVRIEQSIMGNLCNYGSVIIAMRDFTDTIVFGPVDAPEKVSSEIKKHFVKSDKVKLS